MKSSLYRLCLNKLSLCCAVMCVLHQAVMEVRIYAIQAVCYMLPRMLMPPRSQDGCDDFGQNAIWELRQIQVAGVAASTECDDSVSIIITGSHVISHSIQNELQLSPRSGRRAAWHRTPRASRGPFRPRTEGSDPGSLACPEAGDILSLEIQGCQSDI